MMRPRQVAQGALFYQFTIEDHVPADHLLRSIDRFVDFSDMRRYLAPFYSTTGRPSVDPELMLRMLIIGYAMGIRSERRLCEEVRLNLAYRWFCRLDPTDPVPDHSTFSKNRHGRFRESDLFRQLFESVVARCITEGLVGGQTFAPGEMHGVPATYSWPITEGFANLVRVRRRRDEGLAEIRTRWPDLTARMEHTVPDGRQKLKLFLRDPVGFVIYSAVALTVRTPLFRNKSGWHRGR